MIASELARELGIDVGVMSKRLNMYYEEAGEDSREKHLSESVVADLREVNRLLKSGEGLTTRKAILRVLGEFDEPVPPRSARALDARMAALEESVGRVEAKVDRVLALIEGLLNGEVPQETAPSS